MIDKRLAVPFKSHVDGIACCAGHFADDNALLAGDGVDESAFAGVAFADDGDFHNEFFRRVCRDDARVFSSIFSSEHGLIDPIEGRYAQRFAEAEFAKFARRRKTFSLRRPCWRQECVGQIFFAKHLGDFFIERRNAVADIDDKEDETCRFDRLKYLALRYGRSGRRGQRCRSRRCR